MNYEDSSHFGLKHARYQIKNIIYKRMTLRHPSVLKIRILCRIWTAYFLDFSKKANTLSFTQVLLDWDKVYVSVSKHWIPSTKMNEVVTCIVIPNEESDSITLKQFIEEFTMKTLKFYDKLSRKDVQDNIMYIYQPFEIFGNG